MLEMVLEHDEASICHDLLALGANDLTICIPDFALVEPQHKLEANRRNRRELAASIEREARELGRSEKYREGNYTPIRDIGSEFTRLSEHYDLTYRLLVQELTKNLSLLRVDEATVRRASGLAGAYVISWFDALILASIIEDLVKKPREDVAFVTKDHDLAEKASKTTELRLGKCIVFKQFAHAHSYVTRR